MGTWSAVPGTRSGVHTGVRSTSHAASRGGNGELPGCAWAGTPSHEGAVPRGTLSHGAELCRGVHRAVALAAGVGAGRWQRGVPGCKKGCRGGETGGGRDGV